MSELQNISVSLPKGGFDRAGVTAAVKKSGLPGQFEKLAPGPFGKTATSLGVLEGVVAACDLGLAAAEALRGVILDEAASGASFAVPELTRQQRQLVAAFQVAVTADSVERHIAEWVHEPAVEGSLEMDGLSDLLAHDGPPVELLGRVLRIAAAYVQMKAPARTSDEDDAPEPDHAVAATLAAFFELLRRATITYLKSSSLKPLLSALEAREVRVAGYPYDGLEIAERIEVETGLLPVSPSDIVGNDEYVEAGLKLARAVAGYDFEAGKNPKKINPVLFGLGRPGSGKTITAHAVGNYFLNYCRERDVPAQFRVIQRTEWASSYQNASAQNLVRIFREEVYGFDGVSGVYWPDIDTAFASRSAQGLRMEEKQNLGAVFGVFDGTLLPKDGKWFLICDANTLHMDEATISRIAQNPMSVDGPTKPAQYAKMMRELMLDDVARFVPGDDLTWQKVGKLCVEHDLSGRNVESICNNIRSHIQDFEYPDEYFQADGARRKEIIDDLCKPVSSAQVLEYVEDFVEFRQEAEDEAEEEKFKREVESIVRQLNASRAAAALTGEEG
ncbi:AAA family ATPase [Persicimonas caeni]|uniref:AAA family ATPase n=1 Tax=Persicimonas caeni TaxID=2292766 RepID=A0A4Y6PXE0_PERCE|nr:AAA family ATPase [Persicimonas caeni]QDG52799.1 AAA family ATPase [Persicimonas caeni]QED34021.1 AAA family ATPase [Persicimonas caeni]